MNNKGKDPCCYDDIIHLPHYVSTTHPHMSIADRAAQFAPFAALSGHDAAVKETARLTDEKAELDEEEKAVLDEKLKLLVETIKERPEIRITYFQPDEKKAGGSYLTVSQRVKKIDYYSHSLVLMDDLRIPIDQIFKMEGSIFGCL